MEARKNGIRVVTTLPVDLAQKQTEVDQAVKAYNRLKTDRDEMRSLYIEVLALITLFIFMTAVFVFMQVWVPYTWATQFGVRGPGAVDAAMEAAGLNRPLVERYSDFAGGLLRGDLGTSFGGAPVAELIRQALPVTLTVFIVGTVIGWVVGEVLGRVGTWSRHLS